MIKILIGLGLGMFLAFTYPGELKAFRVWATKDVSGLVDRYCSPNHFSEHKY